MAKKKSLLSIIITLIFILFFWWLILIVKIIKNKNSNNKQKENQYNKKSIMSDCEKYFYDVLTQNFSQKYLVLPQVNLATIINKTKDFPTQYQNELNRNIDFGIFDKITLTPLLLIEINDKTHSQKNRIYRDKKVREICDMAQINLITFYTNFKNEQAYIVNRVNSELKKQA